MEPVSLIVAALAAGALSGTGEAAASAVKDAYAALRSAVADRIRGRAAAEVVLSEHQTDPETYSKPLEKQLHEAGVDQDPRILELAKALIAAMETSGGAPGKYAVDLQGAQGVQVGDGNTQHNTF